MAIPNDISLQGFSPADQARSIHTTLCERQDKTIEAYTRNFKLLRMLERRGQTEMNVDGRGRVAAVQDAVHDLIPTSSVTGRTFFSKNLWVNAGVEYRSYEMTDFITEREMLENRGSNKLVDLMGKQAKRMETSWGQQMNPQCYNDGDLDENRDRWHGIHSFMGVATSGTNSQGYDWNSATVEDLIDVSTATHNVDILVMKPDDRYCGLSTVPYNYGGSLKAGSGQTFLEGEVPPESDFWSPAIINTKTTRFGAIAGSGTNFAAYGPELLRFGLMMNRRNGPDAHADVVFMDRSMLVDIQNKLATAERVLVRSENGLRAFGFIDVLEFDNVEITTEYAIGGAYVERSNVISRVPCAIAVPTKQVRILSMRDRLMDWKPPFEDPDAKGFKFWGCSDGNFFWGSPRGYVMWAQYVA